jgi:preprotein translocase subunit SecE
MVAYFQGVWDELKKVQWPNRDELLRMTGIVMATVVLFGVLIGGADYVLSLGVKQLYTSSGTSQSQPATTQSPSTVNGQPPHATPLP